MAMSEEAKQARREYMARDVYKRQGFLHEGGLKGGEHMRLYEPLEKAKRIKKKEGTY